MERKHETYNLKNMIEEDLKGCVSDDPDLFFYQLCMDLFL